MSRQYLNTTILILTCSVFMWTMTTTGIFLQQPYGSWDDSTWQWRYGYKSPLCPVPCSWQTFVCDQVRYFHIRLCLCLPWLDEDRGRHMSSKSRPEHILCVRCCGSHQFHGVYSWRSPVPWSCNKVQRRMQSRRSPSLVPSPNECTMLKRHRFGLPLLECSESHMRCCANTSKP